MIIAFKIFAILLAFIAVSKSYLDYRKRLEPLVMFIFWLVVWTIATILIAYPLLIERLNALLPEGSLTVGSLSSVAFIFMLFVIYRVYAKAARIEYQLNQLVRKTSLEALSVNKKKS